MGGAIHSQVYLDCKRKGTEWVWSSKWDSSVSPWSLLDFLPPRFCIYWGGHVNSVPKSTLCCSYTKKPRQALNLLYSQWWPYLVIFLPPLLSSGITGTNYHAQLLGAWDQSRGLSLLDEHLSICTTFPAIYYIDWHIYVEPSLHSCNEINLTILSRKYYQIEFARVHWEFLFPCLSGKYLPSFFSFPSLPPFFPLFFPTISALALEWYWLTESLWLSSHPCFMG